MGGLDFQVEHHLAPRLPHTVYPLVAQRLELACKERDLVIQSHATPWHAVRAHARWLKAMGARPESHAERERAQSGDGSDWARSDR
jgi:linoleoyl-CoA desaturase